MGERHRADEGIASSPSRPPGVKYPPVAEGGQGWTCKVHFFAPWIESPVIPSNPPELWRLRSCGMLGQSHTPSSIKQFLLVSELGHREEGLMFFSFISAWAGEVPLNTCMTLMRNPIHPLFMRDIPTVNRGFDGTYSSSHNLVCYITTTRVALFIHWPCQHRRITA